MLLSCDCADKSTTGQTWVASLYVHEARFGARVLSLVKVAKPLLPWWHYCHAVQRCLNTYHFLHTIRGDK